jgi:hypothetical protein
MVTKARRHHVDLRLLHLYRRVTIYAAARGFAAAGTTTLVKYPQSGHSNATSPGASHSASICMISSMVPEHRWHRIARLRPGEKQSAIGAVLRCGCPYVRYNT